MASPDEHEPGTEPGVRDYATLALACGVILIAVLLFARRGGPGIGSSDEPAPSDEASVPPMPLADMRPLEEPRDGFIGSEACRECHEDNHRTWFASYHRTMTQPATPETVIGDFDNRTLSLVGTNGLKRFHLRKNDEHFWLETLTDKELVSGPEGLPGMFPVVMTTGSHHMQVYWMSVGQERTMGMLPAVYLREDQRWIPRRSSFLKPPGSPVTFEIGRWDEGCVRCHTTGGRPHRAEAADGGAYYDSEVSEFGISCEACHGKGAEHIRLRRAVAGTGRDPAADPIVNPVDLDARLSAQVCGSCHNAMIFKTAAHVHTPGRSRDTNQVAQMGLDEPTREYLMGLYPDAEPEDARRQVERDLKGMFWPDGLIRVVGREYSAMRESDCHTGGAMSCTSCHRMHKSDSDPRSLEEWANDLLERGMDGDRACTQCHEEQRFAAREHTRHTASSAGSRCLNCHMPHTTYGLLKASRSHAITSPNVRETLEASRPNACNLCHLDKTLSWTAGYLKQWYGVDSPTIDAPWDQTATAVVGALRGDATVRALMAWHFGWQPALEVSGGKDWVPPILSVLLDDDYDAVRYIAGRSLKRIAGHENSRFDFLAPQEQQRADIREVLTRWSRSVPGNLTNRAEILIAPGGGLDAKAVEAHLLERDNRPVMIIE